MYDRKVSRQQRLIMSTAKRSNAILSSLYPAIVRDKLYGNTDDFDKKNIEGEAGRTISYHNNEMPIAELYSDTTVLFVGM
jgi:hypothetical protein